ncbi:hypothetical protein [Polaromonas vacuolata]|uniref:hypothetical protein n=1 Tax=Polaromonas vacuolata TaxID=37448 RepID=UPI001456306F|nr:hypothetical protein [Polaromonas vacuolata]
MNYKSTPIHADADAQHGHSHAVKKTKARRNSVLNWPAWQRMLAVLPALLLLWLAVLWTGLEAAPW